MPTWVHFLTPVGALVATVLTVVATRRGTEVTGLLGLVKSLQDEVARLHGRVEAAEAKADECGQRVEMLERSQRTDRRAIDRLVDYVHVLRDRLRASGQSVPEPHPDLVEHLD